MRGLCHVFSWLTQCNQAFPLAECSEENPVPYHVLFIAFAGEEAGLIGSKHFVDHPLMDLKKIKFLLTVGMRFSRLT